MNIILFDGVCNLCNGTIQFLIRHDKKNIFYFASLQSDAGQALLKKYDLDALSLKSIVLIQHDRAFIRSTAVLKIAAQLGGFLKIASILFLFPRFIRDFVYNIVAQNRYRWFGKQDVCWVPTPELKSRFLS
jgi:predicted DCC family thiol-disulfide oxidoreductase YuxK